MYIKDKLIQQCHSLCAAYMEGKLGYMKMPEDENPGFSIQELEERLCYFTLPMTLNYQRNSYTLREGALKTYNDTSTKDVFSIKSSYKLTEEQLRGKLMKYKVALQPNKHICTRKTIVTTIHENWGTLSALFEAAHYDFLEMKHLVQVDHKKGFPYLSGPKIFNYRVFIIQEYGGLELKNSEWIDIAPDTHVTQCSVKLGIITQDEANVISKDALSARWREILQGSGIKPIQMHSPLWFWSRNNFVFKL